MHIKQYLNELHQIDKLTKLTTNDDINKNIIVSQCNYVNIVYLLDELTRNGCLSNEWEGNLHGENTHQLCQKRIHKKKEILVKNQCTNYDKKI